MMTTGGWGIYGVQINMGPLMGGREKMKDNGIFKSEIPI
jgi:hypothetical protein